MALFFKLLAFHFSVPQSTNKQQWQQLL